MRWARVWVRVRDLLAILMLGELVAVAVSSPAWWPELAAAVSRTLEPPRPAPPPPAALRPAEPMSPARARLPLASPDVIDRDHDLEPDTMEPTYEH